VIVEDSVAEEFTGKLLSSVGALVTGDPADEKTQVGPLVSENAAVRVESWVAEAVAAGARVLAGGTRDGAAFTPTVLTDVPSDAKVVREEVFGPVMVIQRAASIDEAFAAVNDSKYGLQAGVFTRSLDAAFRANRELEVGGVIIGDVPSYRADQMPYGGVKESGIGREGLHSAMDDLTYEKVMVLTGLSL
jgi:aldehyde dehydrogenase (NAD+)